MVKLRFTYHLFKLDNLCSWGILWFVAYKVWTELRKKAFRFSAAAAWNNLQSDLKLQNTINLNHLKSMVKSVESRLPVCKCFIWSFKCYCYCCCYKGGLMLKRLNRLYILQYLYSVYFGAATFQRQMLYFLLHCIYLTLPAGCVKCKDIEGWRWCNSNSTRTNNNSHI